MKRAGLVSFVVVIAVAVVACGGSSSQNITTDARSADARVVDGASSPFDARLVDGASGTADAAASDAPVVTDDAGGTTPDAAERTVDAPLGDLDATVTTPDAATPDAMEPPPVKTAMRVNHLFLRDPHIFVPTCADITERPVLNISVNSLIDAALNEDGNDADHLLDLSFVLLFNPLEHGGDADGPMDLVFADCTAPASTTSCSATASTLRLPGTFHNQGSGECLGILEGTESPGTLYLGVDEETKYAAIGVTTAAAKACFSTAPQTLTLEIVGAQITLQDAVIAARYTDDGLESGLIRGFISEAKAAETLLPVPLLGDTPLSELLWGGDGNGCPTAGGDDLDVGPDGETLGWYFYLNYTAETVPYNESVVP